MQNNFDEFQKIGEEYNQNKISEEEFIQKLTSINELIKNNITNSDYLKNIFKILKCNTS